MAYHRRLNGVLQYVVASVPAAPEKLRVPSPLFLRPVQTTNLQDDFSHNYKNNYKEKAHQKEDAVKSYYS